MPKYLIQARYTADGLKGLIKDKASGRKAAIQAAAKVVKAKIDSFYFSFGTSDVVMLVDAPDNTSVAALCLAAASSGAVSIHTTPLLSVEEVDAAIDMPSKYRAPGEAK